MLVLLNSYSLEAAKQEKKLTLVKADEVMPSQNIGTESSLIHVLCIVKEK